MPEFTIERAAFLRGLTWAAHGVPAKDAHHPALNMIKLTAESDSVTFAGYDYETSATAPLAADVASPGVAFVPGRLAVQVADSLPDAPVEIRTNGGITELSCGRARFTLMGLDEQTARDYPTLPDILPLTGVLAAEQFVTAVGQVAVAASKDDTLPVLTAVRLEVEDDRVTLVATDRYRIAVRHLWWKSSGTARPLAAHVPARLLQTTAKALPGPDVTVQLDDKANLAGFQSGGWTLTSRLISGEWPRWERWVPSRGDITSTATVTSADFARAIRRVALVAKPNTPITLTFTTGQVQLEAAGGGDAAADVLEASLSGEDIEIHFNPEYLLAAVTSTGAPATSLSFVNPGQPALVTAAPAEDDEHTAGEPDYLHIVVPQKLSHA